MTDLSTSTKNGYLVTNDNQRVQGFEADDKGNIVNKLSDIKFPRALIPAKATANVNLDLNLDSRQEVGKVFNPKDPYSSSNYSTGG